MVDRKPLSGLKETLVPTGLVQRVQLWMQVVKETLPALVKLKEQGLVRFIGITGLPLKIFPYILDRSGGRLLHTCHACML